MKVTKLKVVEDDKLKRSDVDQGYAWVILAGCFTIYWLIIGTIKSYGILYTEMVSYYGTGSGNTAWIGSLILLLMLGMSPISNLLSRIFSFRKISFTGGVLMCLGYFLSGFVPKMELLYLTLGLVGGVGYGFVFAPSSTIISYYFDNHRALANGIMVSGSGVGALTHPFIYRFLVDKFGLPGAMWILGAFLANVCVAACLLRQPPLTQFKNKQTEDYKYSKNVDQEHYVVNTTATDTEHEKSTGKCGHLNFQFSLFKNPRFTMYCIGFILCMNGYGNNLILIPAQIKALGYDNAHAGYGVNIMGVCEVVARLFFGWIADQKCIQRRHIFLISMLTASLFSFIAPMFDSFIFMAIYAGIIGIFPGSFWSLLSVLIIDVVGMENFTSAYGLLMLSLAVGVVVSQPCVGWLEDFYGNWNASFIMTASLFLVGGLIVSLEPLIIRYCMQSPPPVKQNGKNTELSWEPYKIKDDTVIVETSETGSLLLVEDGVEDGVENDFASSRISRTYTPYESGTRFKNYDLLSPAPLANKNDI